MTALALALMLLALRVRSRAVTAILLAAFAILHTTMPAPESIGLAVSVDRSEPAVRAD